MTDSPELKQARHWRKVLFVHANRGAIEAFIESCQPLNSKDGPEARTYLALARWLKRHLKEEAAKLEKAVRLATRNDLRAPVYEFFDGLPCVRGDYLPRARPAQLVWACPHCGERHRQPWEPAELPDEEIMPCQLDPAALCVVAITSFDLPLMIPAYIPGRSP